MEDQELRDKLTALEQRIIAVYESAEKTRKYILVIVIITVAAVALPVIGLFFAIPSFLSSYSALEGL
ncbi:MAG: hypothetical protein UY63_C0017G0050 [Parcubacteria group bacterium GW2011_GWA2_51_10]|nr:MAG: hypothetical protein UY63_C0017G0050 [Parcubacteria group bacterium GW2011_GWA2_51_10]